jgi:hypothetical protein
MQIATTIRVRRIVSCRVGQVTFLNSPTSSPTALNLEGAFVEKAVFFIIPGLAIWSPYAMYDGGSDGNTSSTLTAGSHFFYSCL